MLAVTTTPNMPIIFTPKSTPERRFQQIRRSASRDLQDSIKIDRYRTTLLPTTGCFFLFREKSG
jgi:hypothetical protein